jgi:hypothetical protein
MRRLLFIALACACATLGAHEFDEDLELTNEMDLGIEGEAEVSETLGVWALVGPPLGVIGTGLTIGRAEFQSGSRHRHHQKIGYDSADGTVRFAIPLPCGDVIAGSGGYAWTHLDWHNNPYFGQRDFTTGRGGLMYMTQRICNWVWRLGGSISVDTDADCWGHGVQYGWTLWGRYTLCGWNIHLGVTGLDGLHRQHTWPILGFEVDLGEAWSLSLVYPIDMSLKYRWDCTGAIGVSLRPVLSIHRVRKHDHTPMAIWQYRNLGGELFVSKGWRHGIGRVGVGMMGGDSIKVFNSDGKTLRLAKFGSSAYAQGELGFIF